MSATSTALIGLVSWSVALSIVLVGTRVIATAKGEKELNAFQPDGKDLNPAGQRITRSHANSLEYLAGSVGLMLLAIATGNSAITDGLAMILLYCRMGQSVVHIISTSKPMVALRATLFSAQLGIWIYWIIKLLETT